MKTIEFKCKVITPLILGEAKKGKVEFRPPAIKSAIRFWWRAMHSHLADIKTLKEKEAAIFGGGGEKAIAAKFDLIVSSDSTPSPYNYDNEQTIESINKNDDSMKGLQYLAFSLIHLKHKGNYFATGSDFVLHFFFKDDDIETPQQVLASFCVLVMLGNLGERSRRGLGSFKVEAIKQNNGIELNELDFIHCDGNSLKKNLAQVEKLFGHSANNLNSYSHIYTKNIFISNRNPAFSNWFEAMNDIGAIMENFRLHNTDPSVAHVSKHLHAEKSAAFGLPVKHRDSVPRYNNPVVPLNKEFPRRASPIIIKIIQTDHNQYRWLLIHLEGDFLPVGNDNLNIGQKADTTILNKFFNANAAKMTKL